MSEIRRLFAPGVTPGHLQPAPTLSGVYPELARLDVPDPYSLVMVPAVQDRPPSTYSPFFPQASPRHRVPGSGRRPVTGAADEVCEEGDEGQPGEAREAREGAPPSVFR